MTDPESIVNRISTFPELIFIYNNIFNNHVKNDTLVKLQNTLINNKLLWYEYIKVVIISRIIQISEDFLDINYSGSPHDQLYNAEYGTLIINNRKNVLHTKTSKMFIIDLFSYVKQNEPLHMHNSLIISLFDLCTVPIG
jgi:hypothetical protein